MIYKRYEDDHKDWLKNMIYGLKSFYRNILIINMISQVELCI